ncbi:MAG: hypothetical protein M1816_003401 [Peltula sp. TS41687]|nr:MAG: hypothetical protein M1816_003401 [Peltula sp. TS41687]
MSSDALEFGQGISALFKGVQHILRWITASEKQRTSGNKYCRFLIGSTGQSRKEGYAHPHFRRFSDNGLASLIVSGQKPNRLISSVDLEFGSESGNDDSSTDTETDSCESEEASRPISELRELFLAAAGSVTSLFRLSIVIRNPTPRGRYAKSASMAPLDDTFDIGHVWQRYPRARETTWLLERLGKANTRRRQYFRYRERHGEKLSIAHEPQAGERHRKDRGAYTIAATQLEAGSGREAQSHMSGSKPVTKITPTTATTFVVKKPADQIETLSDAGHSMTSYATSVSEAPHSLRVPPPPEMSAGGKPFECPYCLTIQKVRSRRAWKRHVFSDLQPYVCTFEECGLRMFSERHVWFEHELQAHRKQWCCNACSHPSFHSPEPFKNHLRDCHTKAFTEAQLPVLIDMCQIPVEKIRPTACPLCDDWKVMSTDPDSHGTTAVVTPSQFRRHLGRHLEQLALFALPKRLEDDDMDDLGSDEAAVDLDSGDSIANDIESVESEQRSPQLPPEEHLLHHWVEKGDFEMVRELINEGADVNALGGECHTPLQAAAIIGHEKLVRLLLEAGADVNVQGGYYGNALQAAAATGNEAIVRLVLEADADINAQGGHCGNALQAAVSQDNEVIARLLIEAGADINAQGGYYSSALQVAASKGNEAAVRLLTQAGADINAQGGFYGNALQAAASQGDEAKVRLLIQAGANINAQGGYFGNALQAAASEGNDAIVRLILEKGADINVQGGQYGNALQAAATEGHEVVVRLLLDKGADPNAQGGCWDNALRAAASRGHVAVVELLLEKGADIATRGIDYGTALQAATCEGHEEVVRLLLKKGADNEAMGDEGETLLQLAETKGHEALVQLLSQKRTKFQETDVKGRTALQAAVEEAHEDLVQSSWTTGEVDIFGREQSLVPDRLRRPTELDHEVFRSEEELLDQEVRCLQEIADREQKLGLDHPDTLSSIRELATVYRAQKKWEASEELFVHVMETRKRILGEEHLDTLASMTGLAWDYRERGRSLEAQELIVRVVEIRKRVLGLDHPDTQLSMWRLAQMLMDQGLLQDAETIAVEVMERRKRLLGPDHLDTLSSIENLVQIYMKQGCWKKAEDPEMHVKEIRKRVLGQDHPETLSSMALLASIYKSEGRLVEAEELQTAVVNTNQERLGFENPATLHNFADLARIYRSQGRHEEAEELLVQVMETRKKVLGPEHPDTIASMTYLISFYQQLGWWHKVEELETQAMQSGTKLAEPEVPGTLNSVSSVRSVSRNSNDTLEGYTLRSITHIWESTWARVRMDLSSGALRKMVQDQQREGIQIQELLESLYPDQQAEVRLVLEDMNEGESDAVWSLVYLKPGETTKGRDGWPTVVTTTDISVIFERIRKPGNRGLRSSNHHDAIGLDVKEVDTTQHLRQIVQLQEEQDREADLTTLETEPDQLRVDPDTLTGMANLAVTYRNQKRLEEAEVLEVQVTETRKDVLGLEHPDTLRSMANLVVTYRNQKRWKEAEELEVQVMETNKEALGLEHPDTLRSMANLAETYRCQGQLKEAEELEVVVVETRKEVLGLENLDTLRSMVNLAMTYRSQGRWEEAKELEVQVMETSKKVFGQEHPDTPNKIQEMEEQDRKAYSTTQQTETDQLPVEVAPNKEHKRSEESPPQDILKAALLKDLPLELDGPRPNED